MYVFIFLVKLTEWRPIGKIAAHLACSSARYNTHLYRLAVQAGFYSDAIECWISTQETLVRSSVGAKRLFASFSPVTFGAQRKMTHPMARSTSVSN